MRNLLKNGVKVCPPERDVQYTVLERIGNGSSCVVYRTERCDDQGYREIHLLKEYAPSRFTVPRGSDGVLRPTDEIRDAYLAGMNRFLAGTLNILSLRLRSGLQDSICEILRVFPANGTYYLDMPISEGIVYACVRERSLDDLLRRMRALTLVVGKIHEAGLLCLDLKPGNLLVNQEYQERIMLFDLDSVVSRDELSRGAKVHHSQAWGAPEQKLPSLYKEISEASDLYTIGEMLFHQLFGRHSRPDEHGPSAVFNFQSAPLLNCAGPEKLQGLDTVLRKLVSTSPKIRYQRADELLEALDALIAMNDGEQEPASHHPRQKATRDVFSSRSWQNRPCLDLMCAAIDSGNYTPIRRLVRLHRIQTGVFYGRDDPKYLDAVFHEAAACFAELASSLEVGAIPPSPLTHDFLRLLTKYLTLATLPPSPPRVNPHCGGMSAFAEGLRQIVYLRLAQRQTKSGEERAREDRILLDMAMELARYAGDAETFAELREMAYRN